MRRVLALFMVVLFAAVSLGISDGWATGKSDKAGAKSDKPAKSTDKAADAKKEKLDINTASEDELKALPGIGDAYARKIVEGRQGKDGFYKNKTQLRSRNIVPPATYDKIKDQIIAKQPKKQ